MMKYTSFLKGNGRSDSNDVEKHQITEKEVLDDTSLILFWKTKWWTLASQILGVI